MFEKNLVAMINLHASQSTTYFLPQSKIPARRSSVDAGSHLRINQWTKDLPKWRKTIEYWQKESGFILRLVMLTTRGYDEAPALVTSANQLTTILQKEIENLKKEILSLELQNEQTALNRFYKRKIQHCQMKMNVVTQNYNQVKDKVLEQLTHSFPLTII